MITYALAAAVEQEKNTACFKGGLQRAGVGQMINELVNGHQPCLA